jgi:capsular exopolysaccharide synthesis family protein
MDLRSYVSILRRWLWLIVLGFILGIAISGYVQWYLGLLPVYKAVATVSVGATTDGASQDIASLKLGLDLAPTYAELAQRPPVTRAVVDTLGLPITAQALAVDKLEVVLLKDTSIIEITASDNDPVRAAAIANEVARQLVAMAPRPRHFVQVLAGAQVRHRQSYEPYVIMSVAGVLGPVLALGIVFMAEYLRDHLQTAEEAAQRLDVPILGTIGGRSKRPFHWPLSSSSLRSADGVRSQPIWWAIIETFRQSSSAQVRLKEGLQGRLILVTSPGPGEGKLITAVSLARAWAMTGKKVILVDADPYRPSIHRYFGVSNQVGLTDLFQQDDESEQLEELGAMLLPMDTANFTLLTSGPLSTDASRLLLSRSWHKLLKALAQEADVVVINGPPVLLRPEAVILAANVDGVLLVLDIGKTTLDAANEALEILRRGGGTMLGAVLNKGRLRKMRTPRAGK